MTQRICFAPECGKAIAPHMPFCRTHMASHAQTAGPARWSDASEAYLVAVTCSCSNRAVGIDSTPESAEREGRSRLNGYCYR